jgi:hypothetical protein
MIRTIRVVVLLGWNLSLLAQPTLTPRATLSGNGSPTASAPDTIHGWVGSSIYASHDGGAAWTAHGEHLFWV